MVDFIKYIFHFICYKYVRYTCRLLRASFANASATAKSTPFSWGSLSAGPVASVVLAGFVGLTLGTLLGGG